MKVILTKSFQWFLLGLSLGMLRPWLFQKIPDISETPSLIILGMIFNVACLAFIYGHETGGRK